MLADTAFGREIREEKDQGGIEGGGRGSRGSFGERGRKVERKGERIVGNGRARCSRIGAPVCAMCAESPCWISPLPLHVSYTYTRVGDAIPVAILSFTRRGARNRRRPRDGDPSALCLNPPNWRNSDDLLLWIVRLQKEPAEGGFYRRKIMILKKRSMFLWDFGRNCRGICFLKLWKTNVLS